jgi:hypothetical protein
MNAIKKKLLAYGRSAACAVHQCTIVHDFSDPCAECAVGMWGKDVDCDEKRSLPGVVQMAENLAQAVVAHVSDGFQKRTESETVEIFNQHCKPCEFYRASDQRCAKCGCFLSTKTAWKSAHCPVGKW